MCAAKRMSEVERKKEIIDSAIKVISEKGLERATMEDIIAGTTLSKGGVYHYYKNVFEVFKDIMIFGIEYRNEIIKSHLNKCKKGYEKQFIAKQIVDKMLDNNPYMPLYVELLRNKKRNPELIKLMFELQEKTKERIKDVFDSTFIYFININNFQFLTDFINSIIMSADLLDARENFKENRMLLEQMILLILENREENSDESL